MKTRKPVTHYGTASAAAAFGITLVRTHPQESLTFNLHGAVNQDPNQLWEGIDALSGNLLQRLGWQGTQ